MTKDTIGDKITTDISQMWLELVVNWMKNLKYLCG
jgi:hypothetical protein